MNHTEARIYIEAGYEIAGVRPPEEYPSLHELQFAQAICYHETRYGSAWTAVGVGSNNWGAVQCQGKPPCDLGHCFTFGDSNPNDDGTSTSYLGCFKKYDTVAEGAAGAIKELYVRRPAVRVSAEAGNVLEAVENMLLSTYFTGFGATKRERVNNYFIPVYAALVKIATECSEIMPDGRPPPRTLRLEDPYMTGADVKRLQKLIGCKADGVFGPITKKFVKAWQANRKGLGADGVAGPYAYAHIALAELGR